MEYDNLSKEFLIRRIKTSEDLEILVKSFSYENKPFKEQYEYIKKRKFLSITLLQRVFGVTFPQAKKIIEKMIENQAIKEIDNRYCVLSYTKVEETLKTFKFLGKMKIVNNENLI